MTDEKKQRAPARKFTTLDDHEALDHARWSYARMRHLARLVNSGEFDEAAKMARALTGKDKVTAHAMLKIENGEMVMRDSGWLLRFIVENMGEALTNSGAENYLTMSFRLGATRAECERNLYSVTLQREGKLTPHEARMRAEKERDAALAEVRRLTAELAYAGRPRYSGDASVAVEAIDAAFTRGVEAMREAAAKACEGHWRGCEREPAHVLADVAADIRALKVSP